MNTIFPKNYSDFMAWATALSDTLNVRTKGQCRIGHNKLAAFMAQSLPGSASTFNINTLKALLDQAATANATSVNLTLKQRLLHQVKSDLAHAITHVMDDLCDALHQRVTSCLFDHLNDDDKIVDFCQDYHEGAPALIYEALSEIDPALLERAYNNHIKADPQLHRRTYRYISVTTAGWAYVEFLQDTLCCFLDELGEYYRNNGMPDSVDRAALARWITLSLQHWPGDSTFTERDSDNAAAFNAAMDEVQRSLTTGMPRRYGLTLRAEVIAAPGLIIPAGWQCEDSTTKGQVVQYTLDTFLELEADSLADAATKATREGVRQLSDINELDSFHCWVDPKDIGSL